MKDLFLIGIMLAIFAFGYYIVTRVDRFIEDSRHLITAENRKGQSRVRIAAEDPRLLDAVAPALAQCSEAEPHIGFFLSSGRAERLLEKLSEEQVDIVLLRGRKKLPAGEKYASLSVPADGAARGKVMESGADNTDGSEQLCVVWNGNVGSRDRDRVIFALENESCRLKCGYADYRGGEEK